jgi:hypothetical protein
MGSNYDREVEGRGSVGSTTGGQRKGKVIMVLHKRWRPTAAAAMVVLLTL